MTANNSAPQRGREAEHNQYGKALKGLTVCEVCNNVFFKKSWHHADSHPDFQVELAKKEFHKTLCPACKMVKENMFEGEIIIEHTPEKIEEELINLISGYCERAMKHDPQHRLIKIEKKPGGWLRITTTEDQLAGKLAEKIKDTFHKADVKISYSAEPQEVCRAKVVFLTE